MITVTNSVEIRGKHVHAVIFGSEIDIGFDMGMTEEAIALNHMTVKEAIEVVESAFTELRDTFARLLIYAENKPIKQLVFEPIDVQTIFKGIVAGSSNEARSSAFRQFYAHPSNQDLVLHIKSCPRTGDLPMEGKHVYDVLGFTRERQKRLKSTLAPAERKEAPS